MSSVKKSNIDLFLSYHPVIKKIKREAKALHKSNLLENKTSTLMQCQNSIVKKYGFNNWHHFIQTLKNQHNIYFDNRTIITKTDYEDVDNYFYLGFDPLSQNHKYQNISSSKTHRFIYGENIYSQYDVFFAKQSIKMGNRVFFIDNDNNPNTFPLLIDCAKKHNRQNDIILISKNQHLLYNNFNCLSSSSLIETFYNMLPENNNNFNCTIDYLYLLFSYLKTNNNHITLEDIKKQLITEEFLHNETPDINKDFLIIKERFIKSFDNKLVKEHIKSTIQSLLQIIDDLIKSGIFTNNDDGYSLDFFSIESNNRSKIYLLNGEGFLTKFFTIILKSSFKKLFDINSLNNRKISTDIFFRNPLLIKGMAVFSPQARIFNISLNFSFSHYENLEFPELQSILSNSLLKIIEPKEKEFINMLKDDTDINLKLINLDFSNHKNNKISYILYKDLIFPSIID